MTKTNAMRMLDRAKIKYDVLQYDYDESDLSGVHAAAALSLDPNQVFKTLVTRGGKNGLFVFCGARSQKMREMRRGQEP